MRTFKKQIVLALVLTVALALSLSDGGLLVQVPDSQSADNPTYKTTLAGRISQPN
jgi:hypothetical protein